MATELAFAGSGWITQVHGLAAQALGLPVTHVASRDPEHAAARALMFGAQPCTYPEMPAGAGAAIIATNPARHLIDTRFALDGGAVAIIEKPLAHTLDDADEIVELAERYGQRVGYAENLAFAPIVQEMVKRTELIGELTHLEVRALNPRPTWGRFTSWDWGGGALFDLGVHPIAVAVLLARAADRSAHPVSVSATLEGALDIETDDYAEALITFSSGITARVVASWRNETSVWDAQAASLAGVVRAEIQPVPSLHANGDEVGGAWGSTPLDQYGYIGQLRSFITDFAARRTPVMSAAFGRDILEIVCAAYQSACSGEPVTFPFAGDRSATPNELWKGRRLRFG